MFFATKILGNHRGHLDEDPLRDPRHRSAIQALAQELGLPLETVAARYEALLHERLTHAQVLDFLPVLVVKQLRIIFKSAG